MLFHLQEEMSTLQSSPQSYSPPGPAQNKKTERKHITATLSVNMMELLHAGQPLQNSATNSFSAICTTTQILNWSRPDGAISECCARKHQLLLQRSSWTMDGYRSIPAALLTAAQRGWREGGAVSGPATDAGLYVYGLPGACRRAVSRIQSNMQLLGSEHLTLQ